MRTPLGSRAVSVVPLPRKKMRNTLLAFLLSCYVSTMGETIDFVLEYNGGVSRAKETQKTILFGKRTRDPFQPRKFRSIHTQKPRNFGQNGNSQQIAERGKRQLSGIRSQDLDVGESNIRRYVSRRDRVINPESMPHIPPSQFQPVSRPWLPIGTPDEDFLRPPAFSNDRPPAFSEDRPIAEPSDDLPPAFSNDQQSQSPSTKFPTITVNPTTIDGPAAFPTSMGPSTISPSRESNTTMPSSESLSPAPASSPPPIGSPPPVAMEPSSPPSNTTASFEPTQVPSTLNDTDSPTVVQTIIPEPTAQNNTSELPSLSPTIPPTGLSTITPFPTKQPVNGPTSLAPTTPAPTTNCPPLPTNPPGEFAACAVCGKGMCISDPNAETILPGVTCGMFEMNGFAGNINPGVCNAAPDISAPCGCGFSGIPTISPAPTDMPEPTVGPTSVSEVTPLPSSLSNQTIAPTTNQTSPPSSPESNATDFPSSSDLTNPTGTIEPSKSPSASGPTISPGPTLLTPNPAEPVLPTKSPTISPAPTITTSPTGSPVGEPVLETTAPTTSMPPTTSQEPTAPTTSPAPSPGADGVTPEPLSPMGNVTNLNVTIPETSKEDSRSSLGMILAISGVTMLIISFGAKKLILFQRESSTNVKSFDDEIVDEEEEVEIVFYPEEYDEPLFGVYHTYETEDNFLFESDLTSGQLVSLNDV